MSGIARSYTFPLVDSTAPRRQDDSADSAFVSKVSISGASLLWSTFVRTARSEVDNHLVRFPPGAATGVAVDGAGAAYVTGDADDYGSFEPTPGAFQTASPSSSAIVVKVAPAPAMSIESSSADADAQTPLTLTAIVSGPVTSGTVTFMDSSSPIGNASLAANKATLAVTLPPGIHPLSAILRLPGSASDTPLLHQIVDAPLGCN